MKHRSLVFMLTIVGASLARPAPAAQPGESIVLNPATGDYTVTYCGRDDAQPNNPCVMRRMVFVPATKINPTVTSSFVPTDNGRIEYRYQIRSAADSKQAISVFYIEHVSDIISSIPLSKTPATEVRPEADTVAEYYAARAALRSQSKWRGMAIPAREVVGLRLNWVYHGALGEGLQPGATQGGFGFASDDLPGMSAGYLKGDTKGPSFEDEGPDGDIAEQLEELRQRDRVLRNVAAPKIAVPAPFDRAELLRRIQVEVKTWVDRKLLDAALYAELDRWFQAAIAAAARGDRAGSANHVGSLRARLAAEYPDLDAGDGGGSGGPQHAIDRLAARVLAFDLEYALRR